jgi:hypothetical protein
VRVAEKKHDVFLYLDDNIYSDTYNMDTLKKNYDMLASKPEFQKLRAATKLYAVWDDHGVVFCELKIQLVRSSRYLRDLYHFNSLVRKYC